jgi:hypothetical protein
MVGMTNGMDDLDAERLNAERLSAERLDAERRTPGRRARVAFVIPSAICHPERSRGIRFLDRRRDNARGRIPP